jgi:HSP20 family molecular chaperone IbpA
MTEKTAGAREARTPAAEATLLPPVDVIEDATGITLYADLPGVP